ncbi:hypothetical protein CPG37_08930 [Malaciobacter canalis]|jgi:hypothetical protein|uniref:Cardiolipin synthase N-terminal domain-containing protein n=1 Tax=Malaciobacter canalis TaxID=1912871 RepID=A0ABX4LSZ3_9BACT|nr:PLD nuclease N-terminal domain-containing protein [Malaciobacter canalis]PHO09614.1 hypothetical protein CPG37_08930 [Malaciobacter canalis]QEE31683.1 cardiolipin synthase family protein [Malaciobacter canalis]
MGMPGGFEWLFIMLIVLGFAFLFVYCLVDVLKSEFKGVNKLVWLLAIFFLPLLGSILYIFIGKKQKI